MRVTFQKFMIVTMLVLIFGVVVSKLTARTVYFIYLYVCRCSRSTTAVNGETTAVNDIGVI